MTQTQEPTENSGRFNCLGDGYFLHASEIARCIARERLADYEDYIVGYYEYPA